MATIIIRNSTGSGVIPSSLQQGELAINTKDGKLFYGSGSGNIVKEFTGSGGGGAAFPYTGSALITGSLGVTGSISVFGSSSAPALEIYSNQANVAIPNQIKFSQAGGNILFSGYAGTINDSYGMTLSTAGATRPVRVAGSSGLYVGAASGVSTPAGYVLTEGSVLIGSPTDNAKLYVSGASSAALLRVDSPASSSILVVRGSGNVGLGTGNPSAQLHISASTTDAAYSFLVQNSSGQTLISAQNNRTVNINNANGVNGATSIGTTSGGVYFNQGYNNSFIGNAITFYSGNNHSTIQGWSSPTSGIAVGYAQTNSNPNTGSVFTVKGAAETSGSGVLFVTGSSATRLLTVASETISNILTVSGSGVVGIGASSLTYGSTGTTAGKLTISNTSGNNGLAIRNGDGGYQLAIKTTTNDNIGTEFVWYDGSTATFLQYAGAIGARLGTSGVAQFRATNTDSSATIHTGGSNLERFRVTSAGLVGIGTSSPSASLHVSGSTLIGNITSPALNDTTKVTANTGITTIYNIATGSYDGAFFDYVIRSGSNARAGQIMGLWSGSSVNFTETTTTDFGSTSNFTFGMSISASNMILSSSATSNGWTVKTIVRSI